MKKLSRLRLANFGYYQTADIALDVPGVTLVQGLNLCAEGNTTSNGSGKSLLFGAVPCLRYETMSLPNEGLRQKARKDGWATGTAITLDAEIGGHHYTLTRRLRKTFEYELFRDGKPAKTRTSEYAQAKIAQLLPWSEAAFYSQIYLDSRRPNALQFGTPVQRLGFFADVFDLHHLDAWRKRCANKAEDAREQGKTRAQLEQQIATLTGELQALPPVGDLERLRDEVNAYQSQRMLLWQQQSRMEQCANVYDTYVDLVGRLGPLTGDTIRQFLAAAPDRKARLIARRELYRQWLYYDREREHQEQLERQIDDLSCEHLPPSADGPYTLSSVKATLRAALLDMDVARSALDELNRDIARSRQKLADEALRVSELDSELADCDPGTVGKLETLDDEALAAELEALNDDLLAMRNSVAGQQQALTALDAVDVGCACPSCTQIVAPEFHATARSAVEQSLAHGQRLVKKLRRRVQAAQTLLAYRKARAAHELLTDTLAVQEQALPQAEARAKFTETRYAGLYQIVELMLELEQMPAPPDRPRPADDGEAERKDLEALTVALASIPGALADSCARYLGAGRSKADLYARVNSLHDQIQALDKAHGHQVQQLTEGTAALRMGERIERQIREARDKLSEAVEDPNAYLWTALHSVLASKGLKTMMVQRYAKYLEAALNKHAPLLYREPFRFEFVAEGTNFHIMAHRKDKKVADVRTLSGAESRCFTLLMALAQISVQPAANRCNVMILDEPEQGLDESMKDKFFGDFIPRLRELVPSIIICSPLPLHELVWDRKLLVTRTHELGSRVTETYR